MKEVRKEISILENQLLTGYKLIEIDGRIGSRPLTESEKLQIKEEIIKLKNELNSKK